MGNTDWDAADEDGDDKDEDGDDTDDDNGDGDGADGDDGDGDNTDDGEDSQPAKKRARKMPKRRKTQVPKPPLKAGTYPSKSGHQWNTNVPPRAKAASQNIVRQASGSRNLGNAVSLTNFLHLFLPITMLQNILKYTNEQGRHPNGRA